jgi:hypothetical protein
LVVSDRNSKKKAVFWPIKKKMHLYVLLLNIKSCLTKFI